MCMMAGGSVHPYNPLTGAFAGPTMLLLAQAGL